LALSKCRRFDFGSVAAAATCGKDRLGSILWTQGFAIKVDALGVGQKGLRPRLHQGLCGEQTTQWPV